ncbi:M61 family metallopeptidase [Sandaracinobacteroides saxicola]|uniref:M61 family metallopeptidase n=1 Tax=Sandaracinobacteroides saxicola TaxID=2759707 RepID=A0A7G5IGP3_9SPHN|nr:M61 family metallopeptidase [Sandaracinobacteroides saxicola]QMW22535.1 M61 family metallopeptidase [Sandaracinobacteroides saxicola]
MLHPLAFLVSLALTASAANAAELSAPQPLPIVDAIPAPRDIPYPGTMTLAVDATDTARGIFRVTQRIPVPAPGPFTLLYPKWLPGNHAPRGQIEKLAGLTISAGGKTLRWERDPVDMYAFTVDVPAGVGMLDVSFQFLSATSADQGRIVVTSDMMNLQPNSVALYPAGWFTRRIPVQLSVTWPEGWQAAGALRETSRSGTTISYAPVSFETLVDSPFFAGRWFRKIDLGQNVSLNIVADDERFLKIAPLHVEAHQRLVSQAIKLFGSRPFDRYDFLLALTDTMGGIGLEHHRSSENGVNPGYFTEWDAGPGRRNLLPHEFVHAWNGKYRRGADLFTADFRTPMRNSLMWVYEGQTQFWGYVLGARSGLFSKQDTLDALATIAATLDNRPARAWRSLDDTTNDPIITPRAPKGWLSQQRSEDYYNEGMLIWLEVDAILRRETGGRKGMDDFARAFFAGREGDWGVVTYQFDDVVKTLNGVHPWDWRGLLTRRLTEKASSAPLAGFTLAGYRLTYGENPTPFQKDAMKSAKVNDLSFSGGLVVGAAGKLSQVIWGSAAFDAGLTVSDELIGVDDRPYTDDGLKAAIALKAPVKLLVKAGDRMRAVTLNWTGGLRYPRLERLSASDGSLDRLLEPRP